MSAPTPRGTSAPSNVACKTIPMLVLVIPPAGTNFNRQVAHCLFAVAMKPWNVNNGWLPWNGSTPLVAIHPGELPQVVYPVDIDKLPSFGQSDPIEVAVIP